MEKPDSSSLSVTHFTSTRNRIYSAQQLLPCLEHSCPTRERMAKWWEYQSIRPSSMKTICWWKQNFIFECPAAANIACQIYSLPTIAHPRKIGNASSGCHLKIHLLCMRHTVQARLQYLFCYQFSSHDEALYMNFLLLYTSFDYLAFGVVFHGLVSK